MGLNIKKEETHHLAVRLADLTGESLTEAVTVAIRDRLERSERSRNKEATIRRVKEILAETETVSAPDHAELLYDERGLPK